MLEVEGGCRYMGASRIEGSIGRGAEDGWGGANAAPQGAAPAAPTWPWTGGPAIGGPLRLTAEDKAAYGSWVEMEAAVVA